MKYIVALLGVIACKQQTSYINTTPPKSEGFAVRQYSLDSDNRITINQFNPDGTVEAEALTNGNQQTLSKVTVQDLMTRDFSAKSMNLAGIPAASTGRVVWTLNERKQDGLCFSGTISNYGENLYQCSIDGVFSSQDTSKWVVTSSHWDVFDIEKNGSIKIERCTPNHYQSMSIVLRCRDNLPIVIDMGTTVPPPSSGTPNSFGYRRVAADGKYFLYVKASENPFTCPNLQFVTLNPAEVRLPVRLNTNITSAEMPIEIGRDTITQKFKGVVCEFPYGQLVWGIDSNPGYVVPTPTPTATPTATATPNLTPTPCQSTACVTPTATPTCSSGSWGCGSTTPTATPTSNGGGWGTGTPTPTKTPTPNGGGWGGNNSTPTPTPTGNGGGWQTPLPTPTPTARGW